MHFEIEINYETGDSFDTFTTTDTVGAIWEDIEYAKIALKYIGEFTAFVKFTDRYNNNPTALKDAQKAKWFLHSKTDYNNRMSLIVPLNETKSQQIDAFWVGYFERINSAKIILVETDDTKIVF